MSRVSQARRFLDMLWPEGPEGASCLLLWTRADKRSHWFHELAEAATTAVELAEASDVYLGVGLGIPSRDPGRSARQRVKSRDITAIPAFAADLDVRGPGHKKRRLFESIAEAKEFLDTLPRRPTALVETGGGVQAWWIFHEPWVFDSDDERVLAERMSRGWHNLLRDSARQRAKPREIDATWDLARVLRLPGTWNRKQRTPRPVELVMVSGPRHHPSDFEPWTAAAETPAAVKLTGELELDAGAAPPLGKFLVLCENEPRFRTCWDKRISGGPDSSASAADMTLANYAAQAKWSPQEITNLLIAARRENGENLKLRVDYYANTVSKALAGPAAAADDPLEVFEEIFETGKPELSPGDRATVLQVIAGVLGIEVQRIVVHGGRDPQYIAVLADGRDVVVGGRAEVTSFRAWSKLAFEYGIIMPPPKPKKWLMAQRALQMVVTREPLEEVLESEIWRGYARDHVRGAAVFQPGTDNEEAVDLYQNGMPFRENEMAYLQVASLVKDIRTFHRSRATPQDAVRNLKSLGFEAVRRDAKLKGALVTRRYWRIREVDLL